MTIIEILQIILYASTIAVYCLLVYLLIYMIYRNKKENKKNKRENQELIDARKQLEFLKNRNLFQETEIRVQRDMLKKSNEEITELKNECNKKEEQINKLKVKLYDLYDKEHSK